MYSRSYMLDKTDILQVPLDNIFKIKAIYWTSFLRTNAMIYGNDSKTFSPNEKFFRSHKLF